MNGPVARLLVARAAVLDAARAVRLSASEPGADVDRCLQLAARLDRVAEGYPPLASVIAAPYRTIGSPLCDLRPVVAEARCCPALNVQTMASSSVPMIGAWERPRSAL